MTTIKLLYRKNSYVHQETSYYVSLYNIINNVTSCENTSVAISKFKFCYYPSRAITDRIRSYDYDYD